MGSYIPSTMNGTNTHPSGYPLACGRCKVRGCKNWLLSYNSGMDKPIANKFCVCAQTPSHDAYYTGHGRGTSAHADVPPFLCLRNGLMDCGKFGLWLETHQLGILQKLMVGYRCMCVRVHLFPYLRNGWTDLAETWCVVRGPLAMCFTQNGGICMSTYVTVHTFKHI